MKVDPSLDMPKIIVICGPTGSGKTGFAIDLARQYDGEIVGADSMQVYRYMDIGTAKPTAEGLAAIPHHMIDVVDPDQDFDAAAYASMAADAIRRIMEGGRTVFVVGGTGLYIKALIHGLFEAGSSDPVIRRELRRQAAAQGTSRLHRRLGGIDPASAARIHPNDTHRIVRALEVFEVTGQPLTQFQRHHGFRPKRFHALEIGLSWPRPELYDRINRRVDEMMELGFYDEVKQLLSKGYGPNLKSMQSLGYRHLSAVALGTAKMNDAVSLLKRDHRRYAKRQMTWFGTRNEILWTPLDKPASAVRAIQSFIA